MLIGLLIIPVAVVLSVLPIYLLYYFTFGRWKNPTSDIKEIIREIKKPRTDSGAKSVKETDKPKADTVEDALKGFTKKEISDYLFKHYMK